ncbi:MAG TPA: S53 family peptidase [Bryobacteraceae bacterium]
MFHLKMRHLTGWATMGALYLFCFHALSPAAQRLTPTTPAAAQQQVEFEVYLPLQNASQLDQLLQEQQTAGSANYHKWITPDQFQSQFGPKQSDVAKATQILGNSGLTVTSVNSHGLQVAGTVSGVESAFGISLWNATTSKGTQALTATHALTMPAALSQMGAKVVHFSPTIRQHTHSRNRGTVPANRYSDVGGYWFDDLKQAYDFPSYKKLTGNGTTIAIVMSSDYLKSDIKAYFKHEGLTPPKITEETVLGGAPFDPNSGASLEVELDLEQAGGMAPNAHIILCNIPDLSDLSILSGYATLVEENKADIVSSSFGGPEAAYDAEYNDGVDFSDILTIYEDIFKQGNAQGMTFVASSGDSGGLPIPSVSYFTTPPQNPPVVAGVFLPGVEYPASSPSVTGVGGTNLVTTYMPSVLTSKYVRENADGDPELPYDPYGFGNLVAGGYWGSGGGESMFFKKPLYQLLVNTGSKTRSVPDVSLQMGGCPGGGLVPDTCGVGTDRSFTIEYFAGGLVGVIGTSVAAPGVAGLLALEEENLGGRLGNVNYEIYALAAAQQLSGGSLKFFHQDIPGFNGYFHAGSGYNKVLGNGTVYGRAFILAPGLPAAGMPQTPSNP